MDGMLISTILVVWPTAIALAKLTNAWIRWALIVPASALSSTFAGLWQLSMQIMTQPDHVPNDWQIIILNVMVALVIHPIIMALMTLIFRWRNNRKANG